jgi:GalNAc-alpha-(1->4)-GalNAc-alpha-(1->3)-diNAcBac-PP-undecaprenol alpha-1,4-N-acetyl-D-galactosaminyltransferase
MIIIGEGRNASLLKKQAKQIGVNEKIDFLGVQKNSNKYVAHSTIFVLASLWEGLATVLLEAAVVGTPIVATNAPFGTEDVIEDGVSGYLVPVADVNALSARIVDVLQDPNIRKKFAKNAFDRIQASFSDKVMVNKYQDVFKEITHSTKVLSDQDDLNINEIDLHPFVQ